MKILITGNLGYVGPGLVKELRQHHPNAQIIGYDLGFFAKYITSQHISPDCRLDVQYYGDVRELTKEFLRDVDTVISLAAISNDPIGNKFEQATLDINFNANIAIAKLAKEQGVKKFIFASSCSVYGAAEDAPRTENSSLNPLTAYAKSKVYSEEALEGLADAGFMVTCLRFATACGMSDRLRLDLVLNDFVAGAITSKEITILSDGSPWRPLINVQDMARAIRWAHERTSSNGGNFLVLNTGANEWNHQVKDLAYAVQEIVGDIEVSINENAEPDKRSYRVNFDLFRQLAPDHQPINDLKSSILGLVNGLTAIQFNDAKFRQSELMRLNVVKKLLDGKEIDTNLKLLV